MIETIVLGIIQGLTELLPISSSGHLVLVGYGLGLERPGVQLEVVLHLGTWLAVVWAFRRDLATMLRGVFGGDRAGLALIGRLLVATLPIVVAGLLFKDRIEAAFDSPRIAATLLLVTGVMLIATRLTRDRQRTTRWPDALIMGCAQVVALLPGISRSGSTIAAGFARGLERREAARFSFLMSIPAVFGAAVLEIGGLVRDGAPVAAAVGGVAPAASAPLALALGFVAAFLTGLVAIQLLFRFLDRKRFEWFGVYCLVVGGLSLWLLGAR